MTERRVSILATRPAVFLDRDGVICRNRDDYVKCWAEFEWLPGSLEAIVQLSRQGLVVVVVTNQSALARGLTSEALVEDIHQRMQAGIQESGGRISGVYVCPHRPDEGCNCRKPQPGMLLNAARDLGLDLSRSVMVGDSWTDVLAGQRAGSLTIQLLTGEPLALSGANAGIAKPDYVFHTLMEAVPTIIDLTLGPSRYPPPQP